MNLGMHGSYAATIKNLVESGLGVVCLVDTTAAVFEVASHALRHAGDMTAPLIPYRVRRRYNRRLSDSTTPNDDIIDDSSGAG